MRSVPDIRRVAVAIGLIGGVLSAGPLGAQASAPEIRATHAARIAGGSGTTVMLPIRLVNRSPDSLAVHPVVGAPAGWAVLLGTTPFVLAAHDSDSWLVSLRIPARARAGVYRVGVSARGRHDETLLDDSIRVEIAEKHALGLTISERPSYAISTEPYRIGVLVHNRGNVNAVVVLAATSSLASGIRLADTVALAPDDSRMLHASVHATIEMAPGVDSLNAAAAAAVACYALRS